jgi:hypothetical protein
MTTQYTTILKLALPVQGELSGTWGDVVNDNITQMVEQAVAGKAVINTWTANSHTLTTADGTTSESRCAILELTDSGTALTAAGTVVCPTNTKLYIVDNNTAEIITVQTAAGTGVAVPVGKTMLVYCDGTNVVEGVTHANSLSLGTSTNTVNAISIATDLGAGSSSDSNLPTQLAVKTYVDGQIAATNELSEVLAAGNTTGANDIDVDSAQKVQFRDAAIYLNSSVDGQLDIVADGEVQIDTALVDINGNLDVSGTTNISGSVSFTKNAIAGVAISTTSRSSNTVTVTTSAVHGLTSGDLVNVNGVADTSFNGYFTASVSSTTVFTYSQTGADGSSTGGTSTEVVYNLNASGTALNWMNGPLNIAANSGIDGLEITQSGAGNGLHVTGTTGLVGNLDVGGTTNDGTALVQIAQSGTGRAFSVNRNVASATRAVVNLAQLQASGGAEAVLDIQQTTPASRAIKVTPDGSIDRFSVYGTGALVTTPVAGGHAVFNEGGVDADFRVESDNKAYMFYIDADTDTAYFGGSDNRGFINIEKEPPLASNGAFTSPHIALQALTQPTDNDGFVGMSFAVSDSDNYGFTVGAQRTTGGVGNLVFRNHFNDASGTEMMAIKGSSGIVFNEDGNNQDLRVESNDNENMLFVDASANAIGINQPSPAYALDVLGGTRTTIQTMGVLTNMPNSNWIEVGRWYISNTVQSSRIKITFLGAQGYGENEMGETTFIGTLNNTNDLSGYSWSNAFFTAVSKVAWKYDTDHFKFYVANAQFGAAAPVVYATAGYFEGVANDTGSTSLPAGATEAFYRWQLRLNGSTTSITSISAYETNLVINEDGIDYDFRVESDTNANMLFVDASVDRVGVGATPMTNGSTFQVTSDSTESTNMQLTLRGASDTNKQMIMGFDTTANTAHITTQIAGSAPTPLIFKTGNVVFNEASNDSDFRVESNDNENMLFVDGGNNRVGIGKAAASQPFEVGVFSVFDIGMTINETGVDSDFRVESDGQTHALFVDAADDFVGINTSDTQYGHVTIVPGGTVNSNIVQSPNTTWGLLALRRTSVSSAVNNTTVDVLRFLKRDGSTIMATSHSSGSVYISVRGVSGADQGNYHYSLQHNGLGATGATFTLVSSSSRDTNPVSSIGVVDDGATGGIKVQVTYINNSGVVNGGQCRVLYDGVISPS